MKEDLIASLQAPIHLTSDVFGRQSLKDELFEIFNVAIDTEMERFWETIQLVDENITCEDRTPEHIKQRVSNILINCKKSLINILLFIDTHARIFGALLQVKALLFFD